MKRGDVCTAVEQVGVLRRDIPLKNRCKILVLHLRTYIYIQSFTKSLLERNECIRWVQSA